jgi:hypothetical protein
VWQSIVSFRLVPEWPVYVRLKSEREPLSCCQWAIRVKWVLWTMTDRAAILQTICESIAHGDTTEAGAVARREYPFEPQEVAGRDYDELTCTRIFIRDGFIDRYAGTRLVFPGTLRLLSRLLPAEFPFHPNWKMSATHSAYWELFPTIDHVVPVARGGKDDESNWVTTSQLRNSAKAAWTLNELGWSLQPPGDVREWDGLMSWFLATVSEEALRQDRYLRAWQKAARISLAP